MPGYMTHYIFGRLEYKKLQQGDIKYAIKNNRNVFHLGLQGPDIFFYYPAAILISRRNLGSIIHDCSTGKYIDKMLEYVMENEKKIGANDKNETNVQNETGIIDKSKKAKNKIDIDIAIAYIAGFLGHYCMDATAHPYIYYRTDYINKDNLYYSKHASLETDIDYLLTQKYLKKKASRIHYGKLLQLTERQCKVVAGLLAYACNATYKNIKFGRKTARLVIKNMGNIINLINDKNGVKKQAAHHASKIIKISKNLESILICDNYKLIYDDPLNMAKREWYNPFERQKNACDSDKSTQNINKENIKRKENFYELMDIASDMYQNMIISMEQVLENGDRNLFSNSVGNRSMLSGL